MQGCIFDAARFLDAQRQADRYDTELKDSGEYELLESENLPEGFSLSGQDAQISFELATGEMYRIDLQEKGMETAVPIYARKIQDKIDRSDSSV